MDAQTNLQNQPAYELIEKYGHYGLVQARASSRYYVCWYEADARQTRRVSLGTNKSSEAHEKMRFLTDLNVAVVRKGFDYRRQRVRSQRLSR